MPSIVALTAMLCIGILVGIELENTISHQSPREHGWQGMAMPSRDIRRRDPHQFGDRIAHALTLTPMQRARIDSIMARRLTDIQQVRQEMHPRMRRIFLQTRAEIDSVLTPAQREQLHKMFPHHEREGRDTTSIDPPR
jgi:Spy/CpxP family protein refolding chaperone